MEQDLLNIGANALRKAALDQEAKKFILGNDTVFKVLKKAADRYIGGETLEETIPKVIRQTENGFKCSIEFMGEETLTEKEANAATQEFIGICQEIERQNLNSTVSLDLSHIGLAISKELGLNNLMAILKETEKAGTEVIISAEGTDKTDAVIETYKRASSQYKNASITLQAYLYRTEDDFKDLINEQGRIRMVKGAFDTPAGLSIPRGMKLDETYLHYIDRLLAQNHLCSIATHHHEIQQEAVRMIKNSGTARELYEFESLYGVCTDQLEALKAQGHPTKLYFVYGKEWYLYLCNRIAEYPMNIFRALHDIVE